MYDTFGSACLGTLTLTLKIRSRVAKGEGKEQRRLASNVILGSRFSVVGE